MTAIRKREIQPVASDLEWARWFEETRAALRASAKDAVAGVQASIRQMNAEISLQSKRRAQADLRAGQQHHLLVVGSMDMNIAKLLRRLADLTGLLRDERPAQRHRDHAVREIGEIALDLDAFARQAYVRVQMGACVWVVRNLAFPRHGLPAQYRSSMPEPVRSFWEAYNAKEVPLILRQQPNARQISAADKVLPWFFYVTDSHDRSALWLRHIPLSWRKVGDILDRSHTWAVLAEARAVDQIVKRLGSDLSLGAF